MAKKSWKINVLLLIILAVSSLTCALSATGRIPGLNDVSLQYWGYVQVFATPADNTFVCNAHNNNGLQFDAPPTSFVGSGGVGIGFYTGPVGSTTVDITVTDPDSGYSVSVTETVFARQTIQITLDVQLPYTPTPSPVINPTTNPSQPTPTPVTVPTTVTLQVNNAFSAPVAYAERIVMSVYTTPAINNAMATLTAYKNNVEVFSQPISLNSNGIGGALIQPHSIFQPPYGDVTWKATVNGVISNTVTTYMGSIPTPEPTQNPYSTPTPSPYPSSTPTINITPAINPFTSRSEVAIITGVIAIVSLIALIWYNRKK